MLRFIVSECRAAGPTLWPVQMSTLKCWSGFSSAEIPFCILSSKQEREREGWVQLGRSGWTCTGCIWVRQPAWCTTLLHVLACIHHCTSTNTPILPFSTPLHHLSPTTRWCSISKEILSTQFAFSYFYEETISFSERNACRCPSKTLSPLLVSSEAILRTNCTDCQSMTWMLNYMLLISVSLWNVKETFICFSSSYRLVALFMTPCISEVFDCLSCQQYWISIPNLSLAHPQLIRQSWPIRQLTKRIDIAEPNVQQSNQTMNSDCSKRSVVSNMILVESEYSPLWSFVM